MRDGKLLKINKIKKTERITELENILILNKIEYEYSDFIDGMISYVLLEISNELEPKLYIKTGFHKYDIHLVNTPYIIY
jgi:hypothetical protein